MSDFDDLLDAVLALRRDLEEHKTTTRHMLRVGPVTQRDHEKGVRVEHGTQADPDASPWIQPSERSGGERALPRQGEHLMVLAPYGDPEQGIALPFGHNDAFPNPAPDGDTTILFNRDGCTVSVKGGKLAFVAKETTLTVGQAVLHLTEEAATLSLGNVAYRLDGDGHALKGGKVTHDAHNIGGSHVHAGVRSGAEKTRPPDP